MSDHKYCERHMKRGRNRSRKQGEGQSGHSVTGTTKTTSSTIKQMPPMASSMSESNSLCLGTNQPLYNNAPSALATPCSASSSGNRSILDKVNFSGKYQDVNFKESQCSIPKPQNDSHESARGEFGQVSFDSFLNPFNESSPFVNCSNYGTSSEECIIDIKSTKPQNGLLHQFFTDRPNNDNNDNNNNSQSKSSWKDMNMNSERTQLSISIPSINEKVLSSPPKHSRNLETTIMQASWIPVNWESSSMGGGPLAEVLNNTNNNKNNNSIDSKAPSLNLMIGGGWDGGSSYMASSPTGVLQKAAFLSSTNSSAGSSPSASTDISKAYIGGGVNNLYSNVFVSSHTNPVLPDL